MNIITSTFSVAITNPGATLMQTRSTRR